MLLEKYIAGKFKAYNDSACNLFASDGVEGWGTVRSSPGPHALFLAFTLTYMAFPMFMNNNINFLVLGGLMFILILSAMLRVMPPMFCVGWSDVVMGWGTGFILGALWLFFIRWINAKYPSNSFTYFGKSKVIGSNVFLKKVPFDVKKQKKRHDVLRVKMKHVPILPKPFKDTMGDLTAGISTWHTSSQQGRIIFFRICLNKIVKHCIHRHSTI